MSKWNELSMKDKSQLMRLFLDNGVDSIDDMRKYYDGGDKVTDEDRIRPKKFSLLSPEKIVNRVYGEEGGNYDILGALGNYLRNSDTAVSDRIDRIEYLLEEHPDLLDSKAVYDEEPDYLREYLNTAGLFGIGKPIDFFKSHEDAKRLYFGYKPKYGTLEPARYRPTIGSPDVTMQFNPLLTDQAFEGEVWPTYVNWRYQEPVYKGYEIPKDLGKTGQIRSFPYLNGAGISSGYDSKGQYISLYDKWDYNTRVSGKNGDNIGWLTGGRPFDIYNRYYLDDWFDIPEEARGNPYIDPAVIIAERPDNSHALGGHKYTVGGDLDNISYDIEPAVVTARQKKPFWERVDNFANGAEIATSLASLGMTGASLAAPNPVTLGGAIITNLLSAGIDGYQLARALHSKDYEGALINGGELLMSLVGAKALKNAKKLYAADKALQASGAPRTMVKHTVGRRAATRHAVQKTKEAADAATNAVRGHTLSTFPDFYDGIVAPINSLQ